MGFRIYSATTVLLIILIMMCAGCTQHRFFEENTRISDGKWNIYDTIFFNVEISDTSSRYSFYVNVRNDLSYPYSNLFLFLKTTFPDRRFAMDTLECTLARYDGKWLGSGIGSVRYNRFLIQEQVGFRQAGTYTFGFIQAMRTKELEGIRDIGLRIEKF